MNLFADDGLGTIPERATRAYSVRVRETRHETVEASSLHEAASQMRAKLEKEGRWGLVRIETVEDPDTEEGQEVFSWCEGCRKPRLEDDQGWHVDVEDGIETCPECVESMEEAS